MPLATINEIPRPVLGSVEGTCPEQQRRMTQIGTDSIKSAFISVNLRPIFEGVIELCCASDAI